jgi:hypothetical protein
MATFSAPPILPRAGVTGGANRTHSKITGNGAGGNAVAASVLRFGPFPKGCRVDEVQLWPSAATASLTCKVGYTPTDGTAGDDDAFIAAGTSIATAGARVSSNTPDGPVVLLKESYIDVTTAAATLLSTTDVNLLVDQTWVGLP